MLISQEIGAKRASKSQIFFVLLASFLLLASSIFPSIFAPQTYTGSSVATLPPIQVKNDAYSLLQSTTTASTTKVLPQVAKTPVCQSLSGNILEEADSAKNSKNDCWWLDSGGIFYMQNQKDGRSYSSSLKGGLTHTSIWRNHYAKSNPSDTDGGLHPQNILRLISKLKWQNVNQEIFFRINDYHASPSDNRNMSNGVFLISRYKDSQTLYLGGLRVDGSAIIKKKINGKYTTLDSVDYFSDKVYDPLSAPIVLPLNHWMGLRLTTANNSDGSVSITLSTNTSGTSGSWTNVLSVTDNKALSDSQPIAPEGSVGIRTDFMDVDFKQYLITSL